MINSIFNLNIHNNPFEVKTSNPGHCFIKSTFRSPLAKTPQVYFCWVSWWYCPGAAQLGFGSPMWRRDFGKLLAFFGTGRKSRMFTVAGPGPILSPAFAMSRVNSFS